MEFPFEVCFGMLYENDDGKEQFRPKSGAGCLQTWENGSLQARKTTDCASSEMDRH